MRVPSKAPGPDHSTSTQHGLVLGQGFQKQSQQSLSEVKTIYLLASRSHAAFNHVSPPATWTVPSLCREVSAMPGRSTLGPTPMAPVLSPSHVPAQPGEGDNTQPMEVQEEPQQSERPQPRPQQSSTQAHKYKENFGAWMLVTRKERRGQRRGDNRTPGTLDRGRQQTQQTNANTENLVANSRYAALENLEDPAATPAFEGNVPVTKSPIPPKNLPRIRTSNYPQPQTKRRTHQFQPRNQPQTASRGAGGRGGRGGAPRRAAAESEHTVVRGSRHGKRVVSIVVHHHNNSPEPSHRFDMDANAIGDPPDLTGTPGNTLAETAVAMDDDTGQFDQDGLQL
nr:uncharacterized protein LOC109179535 isoform X2 [Ipomoea batatas]